MENLDQLLAQFNAPDINDRWKAVTTAAASSDERVLEALLERVQDPEPEVCAAAARALRGKYDAKKRIAPALIPLLSEPYPEVRAAAAEGLGRSYYVDALQPLIDRLADRESEVRAAAADALGHYYSQRAANRLLGVLHDDEAEVRVNAVKSLVNLHATAAITPIIDLALHDAEYDVRREAIEGLGYLVVPDEQHPLTFFFEERDAIGRLIDLTYLPEPTEPPDAPPRLRSNTYGEHEIVETAIEALGNIGSDRAVNRLVNVLCDWDAELGVRFAALRALGQIGDYRVTPILIATMSDPQPYIRVAAANALRHLGDPAALPALDRFANDEADELGKAATAAAAEIRYELSWQDLERVAEYLRGTDSLKRHRAIKTLGQFDEPAAKELVYEALDLSLKDNDAVLFGYAAAMLVNLGESRIGPLLKEAEAVWRERKMVGLVELIDDALDYLERRLSGEEVGVFTTFFDDDDKVELDDDVEDDDEQPI